MWTTRFQTYYYYIFCFHSRPTCLSPSLIENICSFVIIFKWQWTISFLSRFFSMLLALPWLLLHLTLYMSNRNCLPFESTWVHIRFCVGSMLLIFLVFCVVFMCTQSCQCLWIVHSWFSLQFSQTYISSMFNL